MDNRKQHGPPKRFRTLSGVRRFVANVLAKLEDPTQDIDKDKARVMFYGAKILAELIKESELEVRVRALEERSIQTSDVQ